MFLFTLDKVFCKETYECLPSRVKKSMRPASLDLVDCFFLFFPPFFLFHSACKQKQFDAPMAKIIRISIFQQSSELRAVLFQIVPPSFLETTSIIWDEGYFWLVLSSS